MALAMQQRGTWGASPTPPHPAAERQRIKIREMKILLLAVVVLCYIPASAQDTTVTINKKIVTLKEVVVRNDLNVPKFIDLVQKDTSFYKAFKNLKIIGYSALNDIR